MSIYSGNWTTTSSNTNAASSVNIADLVEFAKKFPPLPPADLKRCINCKEEMSEPAMPVCATGFPYGPPTAYLCGLCAVLVKREYFYKPRQ